jgi:hypothetical protein
MIAHWRPAASASSDRKRFRLGLPGVDSSTIDAAAERIGKECLVIAKRKSLIVAALLATIPAALTLGLESNSGLFLNHYAGSFAQAGAALLLPGVLGAIALSGNAHIFHLWIASIWNFIFYFLLCWAIAALIGRAFRRLAKRERASKS